MSVPRLRSLTLVALLTASACADMSAKDGGATTSDTVTMSDTSIADVTVPTDTVTRPDVEADTSPADVDQGALVALKQDPEWTVPGSVVARTAVAVAGTRVAWVEAPTDGAPELVVWDTGAADGAPRAYPVPNLAHPRELVLGDTTLVYVDDRYGDADLFAVDLRTGAEAALVARVGAQEHPALVGDTLVWADCRACVSGDGGAGREIYRKPSLGQPEEAVTSDDTPDDRPALGTLVDGTLAVAWVSGDTRVRVVGGTTDATLDTGRAVAGVAISEGILAFRTPPLIINPDSMRPSDVRLWDVANDTVSAATFHAELAPWIDGVPRAADGVVAWLDGVPAAPERARITVVSTAAAPLLDTMVTGAVTLAVSGERVAILAPRADNGGLLDLWIRELP
ncbi:MAG: hypothetical protein EP329_27545 [Deltaproteobacteria bacterium]|nr:MAG: hypothetical protein EP329_27545 [Deltaproteobacteria bacterium]